jgi:acyl-CoA dehydrogenase
MDEATFGEVRDAVRRFVREKVLPREDEIEETDAIPGNLRAEAAALGLFGYALPAEYGGSGVSMAQDVRLALEFGYATPAFRSMFGTNNGIAGQVIAKFGSDAQKKAFLPALASGEMVASFALTESEAGSSPAGLRTSARRDGAGQDRAGQDRAGQDGGGQDGGDWILNGTKRFITNAPLADLFVVFARTDPAAEAGRGISVFAVDAASPGLTVGPRDHKMGQRGAWTAEVAFDDVLVPPDRLIGEEGRGYRSAMTVLARGRLHIAAVCVGTAQRILDESVAHAATSKQGGQLIGSYQLVQAMLADCYAEIEAGRSLVLSTADDYDAGRNVAAGPSAAKLYCSEMVSRVADRGVQIHGGLGYMSSTVVERLYRDSRLYRLYEGTSEIQKLIIARELLAAAQSR